MATSTESAPDRERALASYREQAAGYDATYRYSTRIRRLAVEMLALRKGDTVFDVACGTGNLFPALCERVGAEGRVVGIEFSKEMAAIAAARIANGGMANVELLQADAETARTASRADALLFCYTQDVLQSAAALDNLFAMAKPGARVVAAGSKLLSRWWSGPIDAWTRFRVRGYMTTYRGLDRPWQPLIRFCPDLKVARTFNFGTSYLAAGTCSGSRMKP